MYTILAVAIVIVILFILWRYFTTEDFETRREKAAVIHEWFGQKGSPKYSEYRAAVPGSDIVEYDQVRALFTTGGAPTVNDVERLL